MWTKKSPPLFILSKPCGVNFTTPSPTEINGVSSWIYFHGLGIVKIIGLHRRLTLLWGNRENVPLLVGGGETVLVGFTLCFWHCLVKRSHYQVPNEPASTTLNEVFKTAFPSENENTSFVPIFKINCIVLPLSMRCLTSKLPSLVRRKTLTLFPSSKLIEVFKNSSLFNQQLHRRGRRGGDGISEVLPLVFIKGFQFLLPRSLAGLSSAPLLYYPPLDFITPVVRVALGRDKFMGTC